MAHHGDHVQQSRTGVEQGKAGVKQGTASVKNEARLVLKKAQQVLKNKERQVLNKAQQVLKTRQDGLKKASGCLHLTTNHNSCFYYRAQVLLSVACDVFFSFQNWQHKSM